MIKYTVVFLVLVLILISCNKPVKEINADIEVNPINQTKPTSKSEGLILIETSDCLSCHKETSKLVGPSFKDISLKYDEGDTELLVSKIINGGSGNWGEVPMNPHLEITNTNAKLMVEYILTIK